MACYLTVGIKHIPMTLSLTFYRFNTLRPRQMTAVLADDIFKCIFLNENVGISIKISLKFDPKGAINNIPALVQKMAWRRPGDKPFSEPMMVTVYWSIYASLGLNELICILHWSKRCWTHWGLNKWLTFCREPFQVQVLYFDSNFTENCSLGFNWWTVIICSGNGLVSSRWEAITCGNNDTVHWHMYASAGNEFNSLSPSDAYMPLAIICHYKPLSEPILKYS